MTTLFDEIRVNCAEVTRRARFVSIDDEGLDRFAEALASEPWPEEDLDPLHHFKGDAETMLAFTLLLDAINFGSGWFPALRKREGMSGYRTIASASKDYFEGNGHPSAEDLRRTTSADMASMLGQDVRHPEVAELLELFARAWRDFGIWLGDRHQNCYANVVESAEHSAEQLVRSLVEMPLYQDVALYDELAVPLYKRAQITAADLYLAFAGEGWGAFKDLDSLTLFADNLVPHVLRCRGVLRYDPGLLARIEARDSLDVGSQEEVEIRAVAVEAVERLVRAVSERGRETSARALDGLLWNAGQDPKIKANPRHRGRCSFY